MKSLAVQRLLMIPKCFSTFTQNSEPITIFFPDYTSDESIYERKITVPVIKRKPKFVSPVERQRLINLYKSIKTSWPVDKHCSITAVVQKTSEISGISEYTLYPILREFLEPQSAKKNERWKNSVEATKLNYSEKSAVRKLVHNFYLQGEMPTIYRIYYALQDNDNLPNLSMETLRGVLRHLRFKYLIHSNTALLQSNGAAFRRIQYITQMKKFRNEKRNIYFVDQTYINTGEIYNGKNKYYIILHAGNDEWLLEGREWVFESTKTKLSPIQFEMWFRNVIDAFQNSVVVIKKQSYNSRLAENIPTKLWPKEDVQKWLIAKNVTIPPDFNNKACFLSLVEKVKNDHKTYVVEEIAKSKGITVLRLPKYHNDLNPFDYVWPLVKTYVDRHAGQSPSGIFIVLNGLAEVTRERWNQYIDKVKNEEVEMYRLDHNIDSTTDSYLKYVGNSHFPGDEISSEPSDYAYESNSDKQGPS